MPETRSPSTPKAGADFIRQIVAADVESGRYGGRVVTRFPPEPNGYLHIGHAKSIVLNFGLAAEFGGRCHLRYDDTNPDPEKEEYVLSMQEDVRWLGYDWGEHLYYASDYFERMYECAVTLIRRGVAYVDSQTSDGIRAGRGTVTEPGVESPFRSRTVEENLDMFERMRAGEFGDGEHVLRAKIDMASPNMLMRDPVLYRIRHATHYRQGDAWCIYPLYDYAHCLEDAFEDVTHSICTLEFENNRELYDWVLDNVGIEEPRPHQYEFARLELEDAVLSKRRIAPLVREGVVAGWDDPRLATVAAIRRRGVPPEAVRLFCEMIGVSKARAVIERSRFDFAVREVLNLSAPRVMAVLDPLKVVITNYEAGTWETIDAPYYPHDVPLEGSRPVQFGRELWIERSDFEEDPPKGFRRLVPGGEVRLRYAYVIRCDEVVKDARGRIVELRCSYDALTSGGSTPDGRKVKGTIQWVSAEHALSAEVRLFERLFLEDVPEAGDGVEEGEDVPDDDRILRHVNPESLVVVEDVKVESSVAMDPADTRYQFERTGYFWRDPVDGVGDKLVFNRIVPLKDTWAKREITPEEPEPRVADKARVARPPAEAGTGEPRAAPKVRDPRMAARFERYTSELGVSEEHADVLAESKAWADFFEVALEEHHDAPSLATWIVTDLRGLLGEGGLDTLRFDGRALGRLAALIDRGAVTRRAAKDVLARMVEEGGDPVELVDAMGLAKVADPKELGAVVHAVLAAWPQKVAEYRDGKKSLIGLFVGEVMKKTGGAADPALARQLLVDELDS